MRLLNFLVSILHLGVCIALYLVFFNQWISAEKTTIPEFASLFFPFLVIFYVILTIYWMLSQKKRSILFVLFFIPLFPACLRWVDFSSKKPIDQNSIKIMTYNMHNGYAENRFRLEKFMENYPADIIMAQEVGGMPEAKPKSPLYPNNLLSHKHLAIYTKGKVLQEAQIDMPCNCNGNAEYADVEINRKTIRLINVYLEPYYIVKSMVAPTSDMSENENKSRILEKSLAEAYKTHVKQVDAVAKFVKDSPYPVVLTGDFNSVPNSYEYFQLKGNMNDGFTEAGNGSGTSFHDYKFPLRIDYIFGSKEIKFSSYKVRRDIHYSDHFPVFATFKIQ